MGKNNHLFKNSAFLALLTTTLLSSPARAASVFSLSFFDNSGNQVGTGTFTDTENTVSVCFPTGKDPNACNNDRPYIPQYSSYYPYNNYREPSRIYVTHLISNFSASFPGIVNNISSGSQWYLDLSTGQQPGSIAYTEYGPFVSFPGQFILQTTAFGNMPRLEMNFKQVTPTYASGTFTTAKQIYPYHLDGTFVATSVPEPLNILGDSIGLGLILVLKRKLP